VTAEETIALIQAQRDALTPEERQKQDDDTLNMAIEHARDQVSTMAKGEFVRSYDVSVDRWCWIFGHFRIPALVDKNGAYFADDPFLLQKGGKMSVPIAEMVDYLKTFYWPRRREMAN